MGCLPGSPAKHWSRSAKEAERAALRRLSIFVGVFGLEAARAVAAGDGMGGERVEDAVVGLVEKSLVAVDSTGSATRYRLLDTTRAYALGKLADSGDAGQVAQFHAAHFCDFLVRVNAGASPLSRAEASAAYGDQVGNVRAALEWCFGEGGDTEAGTALAAAAPLLLRLSLLTECRRWTERAVAGLGEASRGTRREMGLQASLGQSLMFTTGNSEQVRAAFERGLAIAEETGCLEHQVQILGWLHIFHKRGGDYRTAFAYAQQCEAVAGRLGDPAAIAVARCCLGICCQLAGRNDDAREHLTAALAPPRAQHRSTPIGLGFGQWNRARTALARTLWLRGCADQAVEAASRSADEAARFELPVPLCIALIWAASVFLWTGDCASAEERIDAVVEHAERHSLAPYQAAGLGLKGELAIRHGRAGEGIGALRGALGSLHQDRCDLLTPPFTSAIAEGLASTGLLDGALATIDGAIQRAERGGDLLAMPEMLRIRGDVLARMPGADPRDAEAVLVRSLELAGSQGALAWELRAATSLARLRSRWGRAQDAERVLARVYGRFAEGFGTADLRAAKRLLWELGRPAMAG